MENDRDEICKRVVSKMKKKIRLKTFCKVQDDGVNGKIERSYI